MARTVADYRTAPIPERLRVTLAFLEKLTATPEAVTSADVAPLRAAGLGDAAIEEAILVCFAFNLLDRLADALDFEVPNATQLRTAAGVLLRLGYGRGAF